MEKATRMDNQSNLNGSMPVSKENVEKVLKKAQHVGGTIKEYSKEAVDQSVSFAKKYPVHTAIGATVVGFTAGVLYKGLRG